MDKESMATYKITKDGCWYRIYEFDELDWCWRYYDTALTYLGAKYKVKKLIKRNNGVEKGIAYYTEDGQCI